MKQLTIYCSEQIADEIVQILRDYDIENFIHMPAIYGNKLKRKGGFERDQTWPANAFVAFPDESKLTDMIRDLKGCAVKCHVEACLRVVLAPVEEMV